MLLLLLAVLTTPTIAAAPDCRYDRAAMLALDEQAFDQNLTGGWRALSERGCETAAADLIRDWRDAHPALRRRYLSFWHEGQVRALVGQTRAAVALFGRAYKPPREDEIGWNHYVDGSIAFLRRDRRGLDAAHARLAATPKPAGFDPIGPDGKPLPVAWPMNLNVLDGLRRCWGRPYTIAYGPTCAVPMRRVTVPARR